MTWIQYLFGQKGASGGKSKMQNLWDNPQSIQMERGPSGRCGGLPRGGGDSSIQEPQAMLSS